MYNTAGPFTDKTIEERKKLIHLQVEYSVFALQCMVILGVRVVFCSADALEMVLQLRSHLDIGRVWLHIRDIQNTRHKFANAQATPEVIRAHPQKFASCEQKVQQWHPKACVHSGHNNVGLVVSAEHACNQRGLRIQIMRGEPVIP